MNAVVPSVGAARQSRHADRFSVRLLMATQAAPFHMVTWPTNCTFFCIPILPLLVRPGNCVGSSTSIDEIIVRGKNAVAQPVLRASLKNFFVSLGQYASKLDESIGSSTNQIHSQHYFRLMFFSVFPIEQARLASKCYAVLEALGLQQQLSKRKDKCASLAPKDHHSIRKEAVVILTKYLCGTGSGQGCHERC